MDIKEVKEVKEVKVKIYLNDYNLDYGCSYMEGQKNSEIAYIHGFYYGSSTRISEKGNIYTPQTGFKIKKIKIIEYDNEGNNKIILEKIIDFKEIAETEFKISLLSENFICSQLEFNKYSFRENEYYFTINFRHLYRFNNQVEISSISYSKL
jgi:hypothetical protein